MTGAAPVVDADDLAMLAEGFRATLRDSTDPATAVTGMFALGWGELLTDAPAQAAATGFAALGSTGSPAGLVDDVLVRALGLDPAPATAVVLPPPASSALPGRRAGDRLVIDGTASNRLDVAGTVVVAVDSGGTTELLSADAGLVATERAPALDAGHAYRRVRVEIDAAATTTLTAEGTWTAAVGAGRVALAHELVAASRTMLDQARQHALDRMQFGRPVASFQAVRHRLAEALVHIEGAAGVADAAGEGSDPLLAALAKSLAGQAALTTASHAQQVLAGMGFTTDHPFHRWMKRALVVDAVLGSARSLPAEIGAEVLRRGHAPRLVEL